MFISYRFINSRVSFNNSTCNSWFWYSRFWR